MEDKIKELLAALEVVPAGKKAKSIKADLAKAINTMEARALQVFPQEAYWLALAALIVGVVVGAALHARFGG